MLLSHIDAQSLLALATLGGGDVRRRVEHELDRRAVRALVCRLLHEGRSEGRPSTSSAAPAAA